MPSMKIRTALLSRDGQPHRLIVWAPKVGGYVCFLTSEDPDEKHRQLCERFSDGGNTLSFHGVTDEAPWATRYRFYKLIRRHLRLAYYDRKKEQEITG